MIKGILFNTNMVRAILDGRKTATRRVIKFPVNKYTNKVPDANNVSVYTNTLRSEKVNFSEKPFYCFDVKPPYRSGDSLYVRETWNYGYIETSDIPESRETWFEPAHSDCGDYVKALSRYFYKSDGNNPGKEIGMFWRPSIHMPKAAARIWLKVTDVRVERLQDMTVQDMIKEGTRAFGCEPCIEINGKCNPQVSKDAFCGLADRVEEEFSKLWDSTIKKSDIARYGCGANPWVWAIEFERCEKPKEENDG